MGKQIAFIVFTLVALGLVGAESASAAGKRYYPLEPCRAIDTLNGVAAPANLLIPGGQNQWINLRGRCGTPTNASAVAVNVTVLGPGGGPTQHQGHLILFDAGLSISDPIPGLPIPKTSTINWDAGESQVANFAVITFESAKTQIKVWGGYGSSKAGVHLLVDVVGYFK